MSNAAIVLAAGNGTRMKTEKSKLLLSINGRSVIQRSVDALLSVSDIDEVIVAVREEDIEAFSALLDDERVTFVIGGATRQESVINAVETIDEAELVVIHDGARPLVEADDIDRTLRVAAQTGAAALGVRVKDTIKVIDEDNIVVETPDRSTLFAVQTPQIFSLELFRRAIDKAVKDGRDFTDDCGLVEYSGARVTMVEGSYSNIKITTPEDIPLAENILSAKE